jgi:hypothetical protein
MILKIAADNPYASESWRFFEGCRDIHINKMNVEQYKKFEEYSFSVPKPADVQVLFFGDFDNILEPPSGPCIVFISFHSDLTGATEIHCCTHAYLLDDQGKTIERLI